MSDPPGSWICSACNTILDPSLFDDDVLWEGRRDIAASRVTLDEFAMEAKIFGDVVDSGALEENTNPDLAVVKGASVDEEGRDGGFALYATSSAPVVRPDLVPVRTNDRRGRCTPYEEYLLSLIDGARNVEELAEVSQLDADDVVVNVYTLLDKGLIELVSGVRVEQDDEEIDAQGATDVFVVGGELDFSAELELPRKAEGAPPLLASEYLLELKVSSSPVLEPLESFDSTPPLQEVMESDRRPDLEGRAAARHPSLGSRMQAGDLVERAPAGRTEGPAQPGWARRAEQLFEQALKDRDAGNLVSAQMNVKLALTFDASNRRYIRALQRLTEEVDKKPPASPDERGARALALYKEAMRVEEEGGIDRAIELLEEAIRLERSARLCNRLGVIFAMRKHDLDRGLSWIEAAIELAPANKVYRQNKDKVLAMKAGPDKAAPVKALLGFLNRKK